MHPEPASLQPSAIAQHQSHAEAYRAMYATFCAERGLEVEQNDDDWSDADASAWRALVAALAKAHE
jgi:hypothetical protein